MLQSHPHSLQRPLRAALAGLLLTCAALGPGGIAFAQDTAPTEEPRDARGNTGNVGSGAVFRPQTTSDIRAAQGEAVAIEGIEVAGVQVASNQPLVLTSVAPPTYRITQPSTDPDPHLAAVPTEQVMGFTAVRGDVLHGAGDLLLLAVEDGTQAVVRIPNAQIPGEAVPVGALVVAVGPSTESGVFNTHQLTIWPAGAP